MPFERDIVRIVTCDITFLIRYAIGHITDIILATFIYEILENTSNYYTILNFNKLKKQY